MKIINYTFKSHLNMSNQGIILKTGTIECPDHILHGKTFYHNIVTPKSKSGVWGSGVSYFSVEGYKEEFKEIDELRKRFNLPELSDRNL